MITLKSTDGRTMKIRGEGTLRLEYFLKGGAEPNLSARYKRSVVEISNTQMHVLRDVFKKAAGPAPAQ